MTRRAVNPLAELLRLRMLVTWRTYTATASARLESLIFLPAVLMTAYALEEGLYRLLLFVLDPHTFMRSLSVNLVMLMHVSLVFLFLGWSIVPALGFRTNEALDLQRLRLLPVRFRTLFAASTLGTLLDLSTLLPLAMTIGILRFVATIAEPTQAVQFAGMDYLLLGLIGVEFLAMLLLGSLFMILVFLHLLPKVDFTRLLMLVFAGFLVLVVGANLDLVEYPDGTTLFDEIFIDRYNVLPTGPIALAIHELSMGNHPLVWRFLGHGALWLLGGLLANATLMSIAVEGRFFGLETWLNTERIRALSPISERRQRISRWPLWVRHPALVVAWKDWHALLRNRHFFFYKTMPGVLAPTIILLAGRHNLNLLRDQGDLMQWFVPLYLGLTLFIFVAQANLFIANYFAFEREDIGALFTTPVPRAQLIGGKNLFLVAVLMPDMLAIASFSLWFFPGASAWHWFTIFALLLSITFSLLAVGNLAAILYPYYAPLDRPVVSLQGAVVVGLVNSALLLGAGIIFLPSVALLLGTQLWWPGTTISLWLTIPIWLLWQGGIYYALLRLAGQLMPEYEEWIQLRVRGVL